MATLKFKSQSMVTVAPLKEQDLEMSETLALQSDINDLGLTKD